jgi:hypothetical protein
MPCCGTLRARDWRKRRRSATRADRLILRQSVRGIESMTPSASLILLTLRFDRQATASSANADRATKHFRYQNPFFKQTGCHKMALSQRARAYTPNPALPCACPSPFPPRTFGFLNNPSSGQALPLNWGKPFVLNFCSLCPHIVSCFCVGMWFFLLFAPAYYWSCNKRGPGSRAGPRGIGPPGNEALDPAMRAYGNGEQGQRQRRRPGE